MSEKAPYGFSRRVTSVTQDGNKTIVETEEASIAGAIESGKVSVEVGLDDYVLGFYFEDDEMPPILMNGPGRAAVSEGITILLSAKIKDGIRTEGHLKFNSTLVFDKISNILLYRAWKSPLPTLVI